MCYKYTRIWESGIIFYFFRNDLARKYRLVSLCILEVI